jgi:hypothetical protein
MTGSSYTGQTGQYRYSLQFPCFMLGKLCAQVAGRASETRLREYTSPRSTLRYEKDEGGNLKDERGKNADERRT